MMDALPLNWVAYGLAAICGIILAETVYLMIVGNKDKKATILRQEEVSQLRANQVHQEAMTQIEARLRTKRKEQRSALLKQDSMAVFRIEAEISGLEMALQIIESSMSIKKEIPTATY